MEQQKQQITKQVTIQDWLGSENLKTKIAQALPKHITPDRFMRVIITTMQKNQKLKDCTMMSIFDCLMTCSSLGIEPDGRRAYLIPYGKTCQMIIGYQGLIELVKRNGDVSTVFAETVCENDKFKWQDGSVKHSIDFKKPRGDAYAYYAKAMFKDKSVQTAVMTKDDVERIRQRSNGRNSDPWREHFDEMAKKTVLRRLSKMLVLSPEIHDSIAKEDKTEFSALDQEVLDENATNKVESVVSRALSQPSVRQAPELTTNDFEEESIADKTKRQIEEEREEAIAKAKAMKERAADVEEII